MFQLVLQFGNHVFISILSIIVVVLLSKFITRSRISKLNLPPSPSGLPIIGNLHQLGHIPHHTLRSLAQKHGPLLMLHFGQKPVIVVSSAEVAREVLKTQDLNFCTRPHTAYGERQSYSYKDIIFSPYGDYWRKVRMMCVSQLLNAARVASFRSVREEEVGLMINRIHQSYASSSTVVNFSDMIMSFTNDVVCRVALGRKFQRDEGGGKLWKMINEFTYLIGVFNIGDFLPWLSWVNYFNGINARINENVKNLDCFFESVIEEHIEEHRRKNRSGGNGVEDLVDVMLGVEKDNSLGVTFGKDNIKAVILDIFTAGTDTSAQTVVWAMTELIKHPEIMRELQREIRGICKGRPYVSEEDTKKMDYLKMVIKETLRFHILAPLLLPRESIESAQVLGYHIPAKTRVLVNAWAISRDPSSWEDPEEFRPERFKNRSLDYKEQDFAYLPFGAGRRECPGMTFATPTMELPLANLLYHFNWSLPDAAMSAEDLDVTVAPGAVAHKKAPLLLSATLHSF